MSPLRKLLVSLLEKLTDRHHEGPDAPERLAESARVFRLLNPEAGPDEWERFAAELAGSAYGEAWLRGFQHRERWKGSETEWSLAARGVKVPDPNERERREVEELIEAVQRSGNTMVWDGDDDEPKTVFVVKR